MGATSQRTAGPILFVCGLLNPGYQGNVGWPSVHVPDDGIQLLARLLFSRCARVGRTGTAVHWLRVRGAAYVGLSRGRWTLGSRVSAVQASARGQVTAMLPQGLGPGGLRRQRCERHAYWNGCAHMRYTHRGWHAYGAKRVGRQAGRRPGTSQACGVLVCMLRSHQKTLPRCSAPPHTMRT